MEQEILDPEEYFKIIKEKQQKISDEDLSNIYDNCLILLNKYKITGQTKGMRKLIFHLESIEKEKELAGIICYLDLKDEIDKLISELKGESNENKN